MDEEMEAMRKNKTWRLTDRPASRRVQKNKWVYKQRLRNNDSDNAPFRRQ